MRCWDGDILDGVRIVRRRRDVVIGGRRLRRVCARSSSSIGGRILERHGGMGWKKGGKGRRRLNESIKEELA